MLVKDSVMKDIIIFLIVFVLSYLSFIGGVFVLGKLLFPFFTKEELKKRRTA